MASSAADRPVIGLTTYLEQAQTGVWDVQASFLPKAYVDGVTEAGGIAVLLPPQPVDAAVAAAVVGRLDALLVTGGADVDPARYGQRPHPGTGAPREDRDAWEEALLTAAIGADIPFLGICRGMQMLNVVLGGTLHQHLPDVVGDERYQPGGGVFGVAEVLVDDGSALHDVLGDAVTVPVYHHQAIDEVAPAAVVTARTRDDVAQGIEIPGSTYGLAVQWHPEEDASDRRLFASLVQAARADRAARAGAQQ